MKDIDFRNVQDECDKLAKGDGYHVCIRMRSGAEHTGGWYRANGGVIRLDIDNGHFFSIFLSIKDIESVEFVSLA